MTRSESKHRMHLHRTESSIGQAAVMLGIYIAMYLAVGGIVHTLTSPNAVAAMAPGSGMVVTVTDSAAPTPTYVVPSPANDPLVDVSERIESPRECNLSAGIDTDCTF